MNNFCCKSSTSLNNNNWQMMIMMMTFAHQQKFNCQKEDQTNYTIQTSHTLSPTLDDIEQHSVSDSKAISL